MSQLALRYANPYNLQKALQYGQLAYNIGKKMYSTYQSIKPKSAPAAAPTTVANRYKYRSAVKPKSKITYRKTRYVRKIKALNRKVGPSYKKSIYNKKTSKIRRNNTGKLSLQNRIQNGLSLPKTTFARLQWRGSNVISTACANPTYTGTSTISMSNRTFCLNDISFSPTTSSSMNHLVNYAHLWKSLYSEHQVLGASATFKISPTSLPQYQTSTTPPPNDYTHSFQLPLNVKHGFWYARVNYHRASNNSTPGDEVGHRINEAATKVTDPNDNKTEDLWKSMRDFLTDPTVTFKKDSSYVRQKMHVHTEIPLDKTLTGTTSFPGSNTKTSYEIESSTKPVILKVNFSAKKNFQDNNVMRNQPWQTWNTSVSIPNRFLVRIGYIAFGPDGNIAYHIPLSRNPSAVLETDIKYFVAMRDPLISPSTEQLSGQRMMSLPDDIGEMDYFEEPNVELDNNEEITLPDLFSE